MKEKTKEVQKVEKGTFSAIRVVTTTGMFEFSQPDERGIRFYLENDGRERRTQNLCIIGSDLEVGKPVYVKRTRWYYFSPESEFGRNLGQVQKIEILSVSRGDFLAYAQSHTTDGGQGSRRKWLKGCGQRHPEHFESYRRILVERYIRLIQHWFYGSGAEYGQFSNIGDHLARTVIGLVEYYPADGTDYIEDKFSVALNMLGYELVRSYGDEHYHPVLEVFPAEKETGWLYKDEGCEPKIWCGSDLQKFTKGELNECYVKPLMEALEASKDHLWDETAFLIVKTIHLMLSDDLQKNFERCCREIEKNLWQAAFLMGYRIILKEEVLKIAI